LWGDRALWKTAAKTGKQRKIAGDGRGDNRGWCRKVGDNKISSVLVCGSYFSVKFRGGWDGLTKYLLSSSGPRTDRQLRCEHLKVWERNGRNDFNRPWFQIT